MSNKIRTRVKSAHVPQTDLPPVLRPTTKGQFCEEPSRRTPRIAECVKVNKEKKAHTHTHTDILANCHGELLYSGRALPVGPRGAGTLVRLESD